MTTLLLSSLFSFGCHDVTATEISAVDNGDGTYTYQIEVCFGTAAGSETYGFWLDFTGGNLIGYDASITGPTTGNVMNASVPPVSGTGTIEYGDWDDTTGDLLSDDANTDCLIVTVTFDDPITDVTFGGVQPGLGCAPVTINATSCFGQLTVSGSATDASDGCAADGGVTAAAANGFSPYTYSWDNGQTGSTLSNLEPGTYTVTVTDAEGCTETLVLTVDSPSPQDYTVVLTTPDCIGNDVTWGINDSNGASIGSGSLAQNGSTETFNVCGCGAELNLTVPEGTSGNPSLRCDLDMAPDGQIEVFDVNGSSLGTASADGSTITLDCFGLPIKLGEFTVSSSIHDDYMNIIEWFTISEINNDYFILEFTIDGKVWREVSKVDGAGNSTFQNFYKVYHRITENRINYYRLKQVDYDGTINTHNIISIDNTKNHILLKRVNSLGQEVGDNYKGIVFEYYSDGITKKVIR